MIDSPPLARVAKLMTAFALCRVAMTVQVGMLPCIVISTSHSSSMSEQSKGSDKPASDAAPDGGEGAAGGLSGEIGPMLKEAEEKGVKGALLSRLKKAKIGNVNLDPKIGEQQALYYIPQRNRCADYSPDEASEEGRPPALQSRATMDDEGMINVWVDLQKHLENLPHPSAQDTVSRERGIDAEGFDKCPPLNIVIFIVGSRGASLLVSRPEI